MGTQKQDHSVIDTIAELRRECEEAAKAVAIPLRCRFGWHAWQPWSALGLVLMSMCQHRRCGGCGREQWRRVARIGG